jgi:hypothetical protein
MWLRKRTADRVYETVSGLKLLAQRDVGPNAHSVAVDPTRATRSFHSRISEVNPCCEVSVTTATGEDDDD